MILYYALVSVFESWNKFLLDSSLVHPSIPPALPIEVGVLLLRSLRWYESLLTRLGQQMLLRV